MPTMGSRARLSGVTWAAAAITVAIVTIVTLSAQGEPPPVVKLPAVDSAAAFDAASVKTNVSGDLSQVARTTNRTYTATNLPLRLLIAAAFGVPGPASYRVDGGPSWLATARFDIVATLPDGARASQVPGMLRRLLTERFNLAVHTETREVPMYALVPARRDGPLGARLVRAALDCDAIQARNDPIPDAPPGSRGPCDAEIGGSIVGRGQRLTTLARYLTPYAGRPVVDRTGLTGTFDFDLDFPELHGGPGRGLSADVAGGGVFTAVQEQLGLKLESIRGALEYVVIDRAERPADN